jgi:hypothetical protein
MRIFLHTIHCSLAVIKCYLHSESPMGNIPPNCKCAHSRAAWEALHTLGINACYFDHDYDKCYCTVCEPIPRSRSDGKGGIPMRYTRFALRIVPNQSMARGVFSSWPKAFHGTKHDRVKSICELGYLLLPGATTPSGVKIGVRDGLLTKAIHRSVPITLRSAHNF